MIRLEGHLGHFILLLCNAENWAHPIAYIQVELGLVLKDELLARQPNQANAKVLSQEGVTV
ncbi:MAG: hypothetical protein ABI417_19925 [Coleofasciculaceae cyanobacterium]